MSLRSAAKVALACVLPIVLLEIGAQVFGGVGRLGPLASAALTESYGLQYPSRCARGYFGRLEATGETWATLCTDAYGTIEPTSLRALARTGATGEPYILACGGSTTEMATVDQPDRWVARLARQLGVPAINAGASSKDLATCARTIDFLLRHAPKGRAPLILVASNVNTLGNYLAARSAPPWDKRTVPDQPYAPPPLHPELRAHIPGLYHFAASLVSWLGLDATDDGFARALAAGCCHPPAEANRVPARRVDWDDPETHTLYARFVAASLARIEAVLERHGVARERVVFIEEPNAFGFASMPHLVQDFRQPLHGLDGKPLDHATSAALTARYDAIYMDVVAQRYDVIRAASLDLPPAAFFDAVHMTTAGAHAYAARLADLLRPRFPGL